MNADDSRYWIVLADAGGARILVRTGPGAALAEITELSAPEGEGSAARRAQFSDRLPRTHDSHGNSRHAIEPHTPLADVHADRLAGEIAQRLAAGLRDDAYAGLILVAPSRFAGRLDAALDKAVDARVVARLHKDLRHASLPDVQARVAELR